MAIMEDHKKAPRIINCGQNVRTYIFTQDEKPPDEMVDRSMKLWQIVPSICASLLCLPFGIMLGWPSPTYIILLDAENSPLPITMVQSPMIAGFLMFGNIFGTPFSSSTVLPAKYGMLCALIVMTIGWTLMWQATNLFYLLGSRLIIGLGNGYGVGQVKTYIRDLCDGGLRVTLLKCVNLYMGAGVLLAYVFGLFLDFRTFSLVVIAITVGIFFACFMLPLTARECLRYDRVAKARWILRKTRPNALVEDALAKLKTTPTTEQVSFIGIFKLGEIRQNLLVMAIAAFVQQFCGAPATIVYCQFLFRELGVPHAEYCAILYGFIYLISFYIGVFHISKLNKKISLLISCATTGLILAVHIALIYFNLNTQHFAYTSLIIMCLYIIAHTLGLGSVSFGLAEYMFPENTRTSVFHLYFMLFSIFAVIITKLFQVFYSAFPLYVIFCLFAGVATFGCVFIILFIPIKSPVDK